GLLSRQDGRRQNRSVAKVAQLLGTTQHCVNQHVGYPEESNLVAVMIDIFRQMTHDHYNYYVGEFKTNFDILDFLMEILVVFKELVSNSVFPKDWCDMIMLQNSIILKSLTVFFAHNQRLLFPKIRA
ncbi:hypothetical protein NQ318_007992, partial [Aromia moschata]